MSDSKALTITICVTASQSSTNAATTRTETTTFLKLVDGTIFYNAKMAIDADGAEFTKTTPGMTDQADTSFRYSLPEGPSLDSDKVPYIVVPGAEFEKPLGIQSRDIVAVVYRNRIAFAIVGDQGQKLWESVRTSYRSQGTPPTP